jgi:ribosomal protein S18 acetylase RimI-like enzyme
MIRVAQSKDIKGLAEVLTESFHSPNGFLGWTYPLLKMGIYEDLRSRLRSEEPYYSCLVASTALTTKTPQEEIIGTAEIALRYPNTWSLIGLQRPYISNLAVSNSYRRRGVARNLLLKCEQTALEWGFRSISLHVLENNHQAKQLYFSSGYQLDQIEPSLGHWLFKSPRRLLLQKQIKLSK